MGVRELGGLKYIFFDVLMTPEVKRRQEKNQTK